MRITIEIDDGATASVTTSQAVPAQPGESGANPPAELRAAAAAVGARDGGAAPSGPGQGLSSASPGADRGFGPESQGSGAPAAFLRLPPPPFQAAQEGAPVAFTGEGSQPQAGGGDLFGGAAPGAVQASAYVVEQPQAAEETGEAGEEAPYEPPSAKSTKGSSSRRSGG